MLDRSEPRTSIAPYDTRARPRRAQKKSRTSRLFLLTGFRFPGIRFRDKARSDEHDVGRGEATTLGSKTQNAKLVLRSDKVRTATRIGRSVGDAVRD